MRRVVDAHGYDVDARHEVRGDVVGDAAVSVGAPTEVVAIDPDIAAHMNAVELERGLARAAVGRLNALRYQPMPVGK